MKIIVAGAGAGKTRSMAQMVLNRYNEVDSKFIYVITFTNAAKNHVKNKIRELNGHIPRRILVRTIHSFLLNEFIYPYNHLLYGQQFTKVSKIKLPDNHAYKANKLKELAKHKYIHVDRVTQVAKWIIYGKTNDKKEIKLKRRGILSLIPKYLDSIFVDEAQDIDENFSKVIEVLNEIGIYINLIGDPKQDLRGNFAFDNLINKYSNHVIYKTENHRCPISHVLFANNFVSEKEKQVPKTKIFGLLNYCFESEVNTEKLLGLKKWDYIYISRKNDRFLTHPTNNKINEESLEFELKTLLLKSGINENSIDKNTFILKEAILKNLNKIDYDKIFLGMEKILSIKLTKNERRKLSSLFDLNKVQCTQKGFFVRSIDSIKGLEGNNCIFILTTDLAPYLFKEKTNKNKMLNYLYVALTRSKYELLILVTKEVESRYSNNFVINKFKELNVDKLECKN